MHPRCNETVAAKVPGTSKSDSAVQSSGSWPNPARPCFTPEHKGLAPHHTSPPTHPEELAFQGRLVDPALTHGQGQAEPVRSLGPVLSHERLAQQVCGGG
jgi:hypothetical protein